MKNSENTLSVFRRLKRFSPLVLSNQSHKAALREKIVRELQQGKQPGMQAPVIKRAFWPRYAIAAAAALSIGISLGVFFLQGGDNKGQPLAVLREGKDAENTVSPGIPLETGRLYTMPAAKQTNINFKNGALVKLSPLTEFKVTELQNTDTCLRTRISLRQGKLEADLRNVETEPCFTVETELMNIETIGSQFMVEVKKNKQAEVTVLEGAVKLHFFDNTMTMIHDSALPAQAAAKLESLLNDSARILTTGESYTLLYSKKKPIIAGIKQLIKEYTAGTTQQNRELILGKINSDINLLVNRGLPETRNPAAENTQSAAQEKTQPETAIRKSTPFILSTLEKNDPFRSEWTPSMKIKFLELTNATADTGTYSLAINTPQEVSEIFAWQLTLGKKLPLGKKLIVKVRIKADSVMGQGAALAILTDKTKTPLGDLLSYDTTRDQITINGDFDWKEYELTTAEPLSPATQSVTLYLLYLPRTTGAIYFDNIRLEYAGP